MFRTIFKVQIKAFDVVIHTTYFEGYDEAKMYADTIVSTLKEEEDFTFSEKKYQDGSFLYYWKGDYAHEVTLDDSSWVTDYRDNRIKFLPSGLEFDTFEDFQKYLSGTRKAEWIEC